MAVLSVLRLRLAVIPPVVLVQVLAPLFEHVLDVLHVNRHAQFVSHCATLALPKRLTFFRLHYYVQSVRPP